MCADTEKREKKKTTSGTDENGKEKGKSGGEIQTGKEEMGQDESRSGEKPGDLSSRDERSTGTLLRKPRPSRKRTKKMPQQTRGITLTMTKKEKEGASCSAKKGKA